MSWPLHNRIMLFMLYHEKPPGASGLLFLLQL